MSRTLIYRLASRFRSASMERPAIADDSNIVDIPAEIYQNRIDATIPSGVDLTAHLGQLLHFVSGVATAIRLQSPYSAHRYDPRDPIHATDVQWLADSLHNLEMLTSAIEEGSASSIDQACDFLIRTYNGFMDVDAAKVSPNHPLHTFQRAWPNAKLGEGIAILNHIRTAVQPALLKERAAC